MSELLRNLRRKFLNSLLLLGAGCAAGASAPPGPAEVDPLVAAFTDGARPHADRIAALERLHALVAGHPDLSKRTFGRVREKLWVEVQHWHGLSMSALERRGLLAAIAWLADLRDLDVRFQMELHLDRETVKRKRLPDDVLAAVALHLGRWPGSPEAQETVWAAFRDPKERPVVRSACLQSLREFHPGDWARRVVELPAAPDDEWLRDFQRRLR